MIETDRESSLKKLIIASMDGDQEAYKVFLHDISKIAKAYLKKRCAHLSPDRVDDLVQEVLMAVHTKRSSYRRDLPVLPWIFTITKHKLIDEIRSEQRKVKILNGLNGIDATAEKIATYDFEQQEEIEAVLTGLNDKQKEILLLAKVENVPLNDIAEKFKMSLSAVKVTIHRALKNVRR